MATIQASDVLPVRSRVSWGAILAGAVTALTLYIVLFAMGMALALSLTGEVSATNLGIAGGIWMMLAMLVSLFCGGCVAARCTVGEDKTEAALAGLIVWGVFFAMLAFLTTGALNTGFNAVMGAAGTGALATQGRALTNEDLRQAGFTEEQIRNMQAEFTALRERMTNWQEEAREVARDPRTTATAWWIFTGIIVSLAASVAGAVFGAGPNLVITALRVRAAAVTTGTPVQQERETVNR